MSTPYQIFQSEGLWTWWLDNNGNGTNVYNGVTEKGIDFSRSYGTPVGAIEGGQVIVREHHNNSIGDLVVIKGTDGYWLYQHLTSSLQVGQTLPTGGIVGTQNGLPVDTYSTGSHIEVRYSPTYNTSLDSWLQPWINPKAIFSAVSNAQDNSGISLPTSQGSTLVNTIGSNTFVSEGDSNNPFNNVLGGFDFTRFIDASLLLIIAITLLVVGALLLAGKFVADNGGNIARVASVA